MAMDVLDYDALFIPGGLGPMVDIARNAETQRVVACAWDAGMLVGAKRRVVPPRTCRFRWRTHPWRRGHGTSRRRSGSRGLLSMGGS